MMTSGDATPSSVQQEICRFFQRGKCTFGDACLNIHQPAPRAPCVFFALSRCGKGEDCNFAHMIPPLTDATKNDLQVKPTAPSDDEVPRPKCRFYEIGTCRNGNYCRFAHSEPSQDTDRLPDPVPTSHHTSSATYPALDAPSLSTSDDGTTTPDHSDDVELKEGQNDNTEVDVVSNQYAESMDSQLDEKIADDSPYDGSSPYRMREDHPPPGTQDTEDSPPPQRFEAWQGDEVCDGPEESENTKTASDLQQHQEWTDEPLTSPKETDGPVADIYENSEEVGEIGSAQDGEITVDPPSREPGVESPPESSKDQAPSQDADPLDLDSTWVQADPGSYISDLHTETSASNSSNLDVTAGANVYGDRLTHLSNDDRQWPSSYQNSSSSISPEVIQQHWTQYADPTADLRVRFCKFHAQGQCSQGNACKFRHSLSPNEYALLFHETQPQLFSQPIDDGRRAAVVSAFNVCKFYPLGRCRNGDACPYLHVPLPPGPAEEPNPNFLGAERRLQPCKYYSILGDCNRGDQCYYSHDVKFVKGSSNDRTEGSGDHAQWSENQQVLDGAQGSNQPCKRSSKGNCQYGDKCKFLHESRSKDHIQREGSPSSTSGWGQCRGQWNKVQEGWGGESRPCKWYREGNCRLGNRCKFLHDSRRVEGTEENDGQSSGQAERTLEDEGVNDGGWGDNSGGWGDAIDGWTGESANIVDQEQPGADDSTAEASADVDDGWNASASGWGNPIDIWSPKEENPDGNSSRRSDQSSLDGSTIVNKKKYDTTWQSRSQCKDYARGRCKRGKSCSFSHDITDGRNAEAKPSHERRQALAENDGWGQTPYEDEHDLWTTKEPRPYYKKGSCKKGKRLNLSHTPNDTPKGGTSQQTTLQSTTPSGTPVRPRSVEPSQPLSRSPIVPAIDENPWKTPQGDTEPDSTPTDAGGWPDSEPENDHAPWSLGPRPICDYFIRGYCKKGDKCPNRHETSRDLRNGSKSSIAVETSQPTAGSNSDLPVEISPEESLISTEKARQEFQQVLGESALAAQMPPSSKDDSDQQVPDPKLPNDDEKTWSADWPQPGIESLPPSKIQAPCKAFGQGHCPMGDLCLYLHIVETIVEDRGRPPIAAPVEEEHVHIDETERVSAREGSLATDEVPTIENAVEEEGEPVVERTFFNCTVQFGLNNGCSPTEIVAASDTCHAVISNLPPDISHPEAIALVKTIDEDNGFQALELDPDQTKTNVIARFNTPRQAENAVLKLHGQMFGSQPLTTWRSEESIKPPLESRTVRIKWSAPSRSAWFYYTKVSVAKAHEKRLDGMNIDGRKIKAQFARPRPSDTTYAVKVSGFHVNMNEQELTKLAQESQLVHKNAPTYIECPLDDIRDTLAARGSLERFHRLPLDPKSARHTAFARFEHGIDAVLSVHGKQQAYLDKGSLSLQRVFHANYQISERTYQAVSGVLQKLSEAVAAAQCTLDVYFGAEPPVDIHLYADATSVGATTFGKVNRAFYSALLGEVMMTEEDTPVPIWNEYFEMASSSNAVEKLNEDTSFFVKVDKRRRLVRVLGDEESRAKARKGIVKLLKKVQAQRHVIPLDLRGIRILVDGGYTRLQEELGGAHKVTLDLAVPELVVWGNGAELKKATAALAAAVSSENSSTTDVDDTEDCFVCKRRPREPVKLSCTHAYCTACLQYVLLASAGVHFVPPRCLAGCEEYIPYVTVRDVLPMAAEAALLENAFLAYVRAKEEYFFCPLPHCKTVFRRLAEGRVGSVCYTCVSCMRKVCAMCGEEYHEGIDCAVWDNSTE